MFNKLTLAAAVAALVGEAWGHGLVSNPPIRTPGDAFKSNCGEQMFYNVQSDPAGNIQQLNQLKASSFSAGSCNLNLCKGLQFGDVPAANIQSYTGGQVVPITAEIRAPHTGSANVSIIDTASNSIIGSPLIVFPVYASVTAPIPANQTQFSVTIPTNLGSKCATAGACVIQWWWDAPSIDQTYESCIDFTVSGSGSAPAASTTAAATTAAAATTTAPAETSAAETSEAEPTSTEPAAEPTTTAAASATAAAPTTTAQAPATSAAPCGGNTYVRRNAKYARCGGNDWFFSTTCPEGLTCTKYNDWYSACL